MIYWSQRMQGQLHLGDLRLVACGACTFVIRILCLACRRKQKHHHRGIVEKRLLACFQCTSVLLRCTCTTLIAP